MTISVQAFCVRFNSLKNIFTMKACKWLLVLLMCAVSTIYAKPVEVEDQTTENVEEADENLEIDSFACNTLETKVRYHFAYFLVAVK